MLTIGNFVTVRDTANLVRGKLFDHLRLTLWLVQIVEIYFRVFVKLRKRNYSWNCPSSNSYVITDRKELKYYVSYMRTSTLYYAVAEYYCCNSVFCLVLVWEVKFGYFSIWMGNRCLIFRSYIFCLFNSQPIRYNLLP